MAHSPLRDLLLLFVNHFWSWILQMSRVIMKAVACMLLLDCPRGTKRVLHPKTITDTSFWLAQVWSLFQRPLSPILLQKLQKLQKYRDASGSCIAIYFHMYRRQGLMWLSWKVFRSLYAPSTLSGPLRLRVQSRQGHGWESRPLSHSCLAPALEGL